MSALSVVTLNPELLSFKDNILRQQCSVVPINQDGLRLCRELALEMFEIMYANDGAALAAPQAGISLRLVVMDPASMDFGPHVLINPEIIFRSEEVIDGDEGCLSLPSYMGTVSRCVEVHVHSFDLKGEKQDFIAKDWLARIFQHELDHLDGILYPDRLKSSEKLSETGVRAHRRAKIALKKVITNLEEKK